jgi:hypothetical protein
MDDFSVFGSSFGECLHHLTLVLVRCKEKKELKTAPRSSLQILLSQIVYKIVRLRGLFIGLRKVLETLVNLGNSEFHLLVNLGDNPITNRSRIRPELGF